MIPSQHRQHQLFSPSLRSWLPLSHRLEYVCPFWPFQRFPRQWFCLANSALFFVPFPVINPFKTLFIYYIDEFIISRFSCPQSSLPDRTPSQAHALYSFHFLAKPLDRIIYFEVPHSNIYPSFFHSPTHIPLWTLTCLNMYLSFSWWRKNLYSKSGNFWAFLPFSTNSIFSSQQESYT